MTNVAFDYFVSILMFVYFQTSFGFVHFFANVAFKFSLIAPSEFLIEFSPFSLVKSTTMQTKLVSFMCELFFFQIDQMGIIFSGKCKKALYEPLIKYFSEGHKRQAYLQYKHLDTYITYNIIDVSSSYKIPDLSLTVFLPICLLVYDMVPEIGILGTHNQPKNEFNARYADSFSKCRRIQVYYFSIPIL